MSQPRPDGQHPILAAILAHYPRDAAAPVRNFRSGAYIIPA
jgi:hypothetical protein